MDGSFKSTRLTGTELCRPGGLLYFGIDYGKNRLPDDASRNFVDADGSNPGNVIPREKAACRESREWYCWGVNHFGRAGVAVLLTSTLWPPPPPSLSLSLSPHASKAQWSTGWRNLFWRQMESAEGCYWSTTHHAEKPKSSLSGRLALHPFFPENMDFVEHRWIWRSSEENTLVVLN